MDVLIVEDRGSVALLMVEHLKKRGYSVYAAYSTLEAEDILNNPDEEVGCLVVDLNMPANQLTADQRKRTAGAVLTGWVWLKERVLNSKPPEFLQRVIIHSEYMERLESTVPRTEWEGIRRVPRRGSTLQVEKLLQEVAKIVGPREVAK